LIVCYNVLLIGNEMAKTKYFGDEAKYRKQYSFQKCTAKYRGIDWQFTYESWIDWWGDDITKRGRKHGCFVMARNGDIGPYHPDNVRKITHGENIVEAQFGKKRTIETKTKISIKLKGNKNGLGNKGNRINTKGFAQGNIPWNKGLTKNTDSRIKNPYANKV